RLLFSYKKDAGEQLRSFQRMYPLTLADEQSNRRQVRLEIAAINPGNRFELGDRLFYAGESAIDIVYHSKPEFGRAPGHCVYFSLVRAIANRDNKSLGKASIRFLPIYDLPSGCCNRWYEKNDEPAAHGENHSRLRLE